MLFTAARQATRTVHHTHLLRAHSQALSATRQIPRRTYASEAGPTSPGTPGDSNKSTSQSKSDSSNSNSKIFNKKAIYLVIVGLAVVETGFYLNIFTRKRSSEDDTAHPEEQTEGGRGR
ncbi:hypothetical protein D9757_013237 [Collybiopsis confluens]|uniref:Uncharacterized protein n=1 Tax=Collybiopsis confluens TaxID=2823264 RepID=A0A8H5D1Q8_9AGAR|nr:hypothetical protein D9757_013237 [Collybiopsis confluens]